LFYFVKTPFWLTWFYPNRIWKVKTTEKIIYLTFDDGPHPIITPEVLSLLEKYNAKASFFCIGNNVEKYQDVYASIVEAGHAVGNHTHNHLNGWKNEDEKYLKDVVRAADWIDTKIFRPPYGRMSAFQERLLSRTPLELKTIMWTVLSGDFDINLSKEACYKNVRDRVDEGSIVVFHDSDKAAERMLYALPLVLEYYSKKGWRFEALPKVWA
jgi:peptidoglycan/xylan/chitin deacetylase (PgdA/CDA1 family)